MTNTAHWQVRLIQILAVVGMHIAFYLLLFHTGALVVACGADTWMQRVFGIPINCYDVSGPTAPYSKVGPIPVALIGFVGYAGIFTLIWLAGWIPALWRYMRELLISVIGLAVLFTGWLTWLEATRIHAFCEGCLYSAVVVLIMFGLAVSYLFAPHTAVD